MYKKKTTTPCRQKNPRTTIGNQKGCCYFWWSIQCVLNPIPSHLFSINVGEFGSEHTNWTKHTKKMMFNWSIKNNWILFRKTRSIIDIIDIINRLTVYNNNIPIYFQTSRERTNRRLNCIVFHAWTWLNRPKTTIDIHITWVNSNSGSSWKRTKLRKCIESNETLTNGRMWKLNENLYNYNPMCINYILCGNTM